MDGAILRWQPAINKRVGRNDFRNIEPWELNITVPGYPLSLRNCLVQLLANVPWVAELWSNGWAASIYVSNRVFCWDLCRWIPDSNPAAYDS